MTGKVRLAIGLVILLTFSLALVGCGDETVATVNGEEITQKQLDENLEVLSNQYQIDLNDPEFAGMVDALKAQTLDQIIQNVLILQEGKDRNVEVTEAELDSKIDEIVAEFFSGQKQEFDGYLQQLGVSEDFIREELKIELTIEKMINITDEDIETYYNENDPKEVEASHILVETEEEAKGIIDKLQEGEDFAELAKESSTDTQSAVEGGKLGYFGKGLMDPSFEEVAFALAVDDFTVEPVETQFGYHVILVTGSMDELEDLQESIKLTLINQEAGGLLQDINERAEIDYKIEFEQPQMPAGMGGMPATEGENPHETGEIPLEDNVEGQSGEESDDEVNSSEENEEE